MTRYYACYCVSIATLLLANSLAWADEPALGPQPGVMLLRNGSVLHGEILRSGDRYEVGLEDGDLRIRADDVQFVGASLEECYEHQRLGIEFDSVGDHLDLSEWCLRHGLISESGRELRNAIACDPTHPRCSLVERRLMLAIEGPPEPVASEPARIDAPTSDELDQMVRSMPTGTVETFTNTIQPILVNQCSTAGCHGPATSSSLRLMRVAADRTQSRRATQRNLHSVLTNIQHDQPDGSPLLMMPVRPHGGSQTAVFSSRQAMQYRQLVEWAYAVANKRVPKANGTGASPLDWPVAAAKDDPKATTRANRGTQNATIAAKVIERAERAEQAGFIDSDDPFSKIKPAAPQADAQTSDETPAAADDEGKTISDGADDLRRVGSPVHRSAQSVGRHHRLGEKPTRSPAKRGELPQEDLPADEFDPEQFNKQYGT